MPETGAFDAQDPAAITARLCSVGYLPSPELASAVSTALTLRMPLLLEGEPGVGKTSLARALAVASGPIELIRLQCYEGLTAAQAIYDWDFRKQLLTVRSALDGGAAGTIDLYSDEFLFPRKILRAFTHRSVLLIDEIDRADSEFEAYLLEALSDGTISIPEMIEPPNTSMPIVVITSNRTRELHDALRRRCVYHWIDHPTPEREAQILLTAFKEREIEANLAREVAELIGSVRDILDLDFKPGTAAAVDLARAMLEKKQQHLTESLLRELIGLFVKSPDDKQRVEQIVSDARWKDARS